MRKTVYTAFGLTISSDFPIPELSHTNTEYGLTDVIVIKAELSNLWSKLAEPNSYCFVKENFVMIHIPGVAIYLVKNGEEIFVSPMVGASESQVRLYILGSCMGAILLQRKILPLHGSAVVIEGKAYGIVGESGAGKSTLAAAFQKEGYPLLSDDIIAVTFSDDGIPMVTPSYPQQKLWEESLNEFEMRTDFLQPIIDRDTKYFVPIIENFAHNAVPLEGIFELTETEEHTVEMIHTQKLERLQKIFEHTYRNFFIQSLSRLDWHFNISAQIASAITINQLYRPQSRFTAFELVDTILNTLKKGEMVR